MGPMEKSLREVGILTCWRDSKAPSKKKKKKKESKTYFNSGGASTIPIRATSSKKGGHIHSAPQKGGRMFGFLKRTLETRSGNNGKKAEKRREEKCV